MHCAQKISGPAKVRIEPLRMRIQPSGRKITLKRGRDCPLGDVPIIRKTAEK